jgi:hypothetical protein
LRLRPVALRDPPPGAGVWNDGNQAARGRVVGFVTLP